MNTSHRTLAVIPARYASARFPGKVLADRTGKPLIEHVYEQTTQAKRIDHTIIATDDQRIADAVKHFGGEVVITRANHPNGTSRIAEAIEGFDAQIIVNVQGDEPEIEPELIDRAIQTLKESPQCEMSTLASPMAAEDEPANPNLVKVVVDGDGLALYFSRALIPYDPDHSSKHAPLRHVGLYVYRRNFLQTYLSLPETPLERTERLEQLRVLEHGYAIAVAVGNSKAHSIDTPEQYEAFVQRVDSRR